MNALDNPMPQLSHHTLPIDILAQVAVSEVSQEGASHTKAAEHTNQHLTIAGLVQHVARAQGRQELHRHAGLREFRYSPY